MAPIIQEGMMRHRYLFLTLDIFRQTGGIQQVNRLLLQVLSNNCGSSFAQGFFVKTFSLYDAGGLIEPAANGTSVRGFAGRKWAFLLHCIRAARQTDVLILSHIHLLPIAIMLLFLHSGMKIVLLAHGVEFWQKLPLWKRLFIARRVRVWAVSRYTARRVLQNSPGITVQILNNALPADFVPPKKFGKPDVLLKKHGLNKHQPVLLSVCRISRHDQSKGIEKVIRAIPGLLSEFPLLKYFIAGPAENAEQYRLQCLVDNLGVQNHVELLQYVPRPELYKYYLLADVMVLPSKKEGFGLAFIEATACGCRSIGGNQDGSTDALLNGKTGTLIDPDNPVQLQNAIRKDLNRPWSPVQERRLQRACLAHFSHQVYQTKVKQLLQTLHL